MHTQVGIYKCLQRREVPGSARLLTFTCYHDLDLLRNDGIKQVFIDALAWSRQEFGFQLWAWVIMSNHTHILIRPDVARGTVRQFLQAFKPRISNQVLARWRDLRAGVLSRLKDSRGKLHFWQPGGGHDRNLRYGDPIWNAINYVHNNPVKAGLCKSPADWPWSSAREFERRGSGPLPIDSASIPRRKML
ncbi:MAG: transposase [Phycisphaerales bacterium]|nr:transposase [Phycisphaerales bacterium]